MDYTYLKKNCKYYISPHKAIYITSCLNFSIDLYSSSGVVRVIKSRRMKCAGHVARMGEWRGVYRVLGGETRGKETTGETQT
jgi:hypothetical protein